MRVPKIATSRRAYQLQNSRQHGIKFYSLIPLKTNLTDTAVPA